MLFDLYIHEHFLKYIISIAVKFGVLSNKKYNIILTVVRLLFNLNNSIILFNTMPLLFIIRSDFTGIRFKNV